VAVDVVIGTGNGLMAAAIVAPMVRVARFAVWAAGAIPVVMSALVVMVHVVAALIVDVATMKVTAASADMLFATVAANVLLPHPCLVGAVPAASLHSGSTTTIVSPCARGAEHWNVTTTALAAPAMGLLTTSDVPENAATAVAVDVVIGTGNGLMAAAIVAPMVRVFKFADCAAEATPVVISAFVVMVQTVAAASVAVATVNNISALVSALFTTAAVNVLLPQPCLVGAVPEVSVHSGSITAIVSP
jgi:hypothetical protein